MVAKANGQPIDEILAAARRRLNRLDPAAAQADLRVIVMCSQGYTSSLAAASLQDLGLRNATDLDGGFVAWASAGLPVQPG